MNNGKVDAIDVIAGILLALLGYGVYKEYQNEKDERKKIEVLKKAFEEFDCDDYLDEKNETHLGLMNVANELRDMLLDSLDFKEKKLTIKYPISMGTLMRSAIEQVVIVYIERHGKERRNKHYQNEEIMMQILGGKPDEHHIKLMKKMDFFMKEDIRKVLSDIVHAPHDIKKIEKLMINFSTEAGVLKFVKDVAILSNRI
jgi:hypothetical protein